MEERFQTFTLLIANISRNIRKIKSGEMAEYNLKSQHVSCLYYIYKAKSITAKELCDLCDEDKANISRSVKFLEERGYLKCDTKLTKRYLSPLELTESGVAIAKSIGERIDEVLIQSGDGITDTELCGFYKCLGIINDRLQKFAEQYDK